VQEKILNAISTIDISNLCKFSNLTESRSLSQIIIKSNTINFAIDIGILAIDIKAGKKLVAQIKDKLQTVFDLKANIILTSDDKSTKYQEKPANTKFHSIVRGVKNIIVIASGKGGVGKSTASVNLAISLKRLGFKIGLVDADIYGPSITYLMNLQGKPKNDGNLMIPIKSYGIDCISVGSLIEASKAAVWRGPMITKVLTQLIAGTQWNDIDYLIIDLPPGTGDIHLSLIQQFKPDGAILVSTPQNLTIIDVIKAADMFKTLKVPILGVIQNMAYLTDEGGKKNYIFGKDLAKKMAEDLGLNFLGDIEISSQINKTNDEQNPICHSYPSSNIALNFGKIAEKLINF
jgi:ATP-binding protein involved in chromosome partitioning